MGIWAITLVLAALVVVVTRGSVTSLAHMSLRAPWLLLLAAALQVGLAFVEIPEERLDDLGFGLLMLSYALLLAFCLANLGLRGMGVVLVGAAMNTVVIGLNQGMPVTDRTWQDGRLVDDPIERSVKHRPASDDDLVPFLADIIVLPPPIEETISFGDLVLAAGVIDVAFWGSRRRRRRDPDDEEPAVVVEEPVERHPRVERGERDDGAEALRAAAPLTGRSPAVDDDTAVIDLTELPDAMRPSPSAPPPHGSMTAPDTSPPIRWEAPRRP